MAASQPIYDWGIQGFSVGHYEGDALIVDTDHFVFDITGFDDYNGIPSSQLKKVHERYWREGDRAEGDRDGRGSDVPEEAGVLHDAVAARRARVYSVGVGLRSGNLSRAGQDDAAEVQGRTDRFADWDERRRS